MEFTCDNASRPEDHFPVILALGIYRPMLHRGCWYQQRSGVVILASIHTTYHFI